MTKIRKYLSGAVVVTLVAITTPTTSAQGLTVFDPFNYQENLLSSVRALEQINNQVRQLQGQVHMIQRMDQNLQRIGTSIAPDLQRSLGDIQAKLREGNGIALRLQDTETAYARLFPTTLSSTLSSDEVLRNAKTRWDEEHASLQRTALLQGQIVDTIGIDTRLLDDAMARSRTASGALDAAQAGNELTAMSVKQSIQMQTLLTAQTRSETIARARDLATENEARQRFKTFLGNGTAYTAGR